MDWYRAAFVFPHLELLRLEAGFPVAAQQVEKVTRAGDKRGDRGDCK